MPLKKELSIEEWQAVIKEVRAIVETNDGTELHEYLPLSCTHAQEPKLRRQLHATHPATITVVDRPPWMSTTNPPRIVTLSDGSTGSDTPTALIGRRALPAR
jgi:hypothetical protein